MKKIQFINEFLIVYLLSTLKKDQENTKNRQNAPFKHLGLLSLEHGITLPSKDRKIMLKRQVTSPKNHILLHGFILIGDLCNLSLHIHHLFLTNLFLFLQGLHLHFLLILISPLMVNIFQHKRP